VATVLTWWAMTFGLALLVAISVSIGTQLDTAAQRRERQRLALTRRCLRGEGPCADCPLDW
jgi:hypothetical protein